MFPKNSMLFNEEFWGLFGLKIIAENKFRLYMKYIVWLMEVLKYFI